MKGLIDINMSEIGMDYIYEFFFKDLIIKFGGYWKFFDCMFWWKVVIFIFFWNCYEYFFVLFRYLIFMF